MNLPKEPPKRPYRYYSTQRPIGPGTIPPTRIYKPLEVINYDERIPVEHGTMLAWGEVHYSRPLPKQEALNYELKPAPDNPSVHHQRHAHGKTEQSHEQ